MVLASEDKSLSINNSDGDTLRMISLRDIPNDLQFSEMKMDERVAGENTVIFIYIYYTTWHFTVYIVKYLIDTF